ncbi:MAG: GT4 family glycosyltransferase PelF [Acetatifactor sp.]|nr:GT4 family glycosyltransferase PelF [Acetatifactor sp.]
MKICIVAEGCYPYVVGGVSSWIHSMIKSFPDHEFIVMAIVANRSFRGKFAYELPDNLTEVYELYLEDNDWVREGEGKRQKRLTKEEYEALKSLLLNQNVKWKALFKLFATKRISMNELLMGPDFFRAVKDCYQIRYPEVVFSDFLWTMRSIYLPLFLTMRMDVPKADLYHCVATGYAGILGCMAKYKHNCSLIISEHGIYTREREEELIRAKWVEGIYKNIWIEQFRKMSKLAYSEAELVTSLYEHARELQIELGCPKEITMVTPNGIDASRFVVTEDRKRTLEADMIHVGAVLRVTPIKDVKTLIRAFSFAKEKVPALKLWIMGPTDEDPVYAEECMDLVQALAVRDVVFTGRINVTEYLWQMDMTILTSVSEGQPLTILEGYAAHKPAIATDVGNCRGLIYGEGDSFGAAGILTHVMNVEEITAAILELAYSKEKREEMGENGYKRMMSRYKIEHMKAAYQKIYRDIGDWM